MKHSLGIIVTSVAACYAAFAHCDDGVSLYGLVDTGFTFVSNTGGARSYQLTACNASGCRIGFSGRESLGGGVQTIFTLETGFNPLNGKTKDGGTFFGRRAFVGLDGEYGSVTIGRHYPLIGDFVGKFESGGDWAAAGIGYGEHPGDVDNLNSSYRFNNAVRFASRNYGGLTVGGLYSLGSVAGHPGQNQVYSLAASYAAGDFKAGFGYQNAKRPNYAVYGTNVSASATGNNTQSDVFSGFASAGSQQVVAAGASYALGALTFGMVYSNVIFAHLNSTPVSGLSPLEKGYRGNVSFNTFELNMKYQATPALLLGVGGFLTTSGGVSGGDAQRYRQLNVGGTYSLSRRTDTYLLAVYQRASGTNSTGAAAVAAIDGVSPASGNHQFLTLAGIRHRF
ncbi:porin [Pandoraea anhela]|uniref:Porin n=1 Tax=Pandoraea anhela TaxID=2508295 RepID=A0A5E4W981_9BURK|nr:porin [Pandoraea anhela]VVE20663.1 porin [Pandoraea anhela]